jgi:hypothetical protein
MVSLKLEIYTFTVAKTKLKLTRSTRKALHIVSTLRMRIDVAVLVENTRRIFGRAREGNLSSRRIFPTVLVGHTKKKKKKKKTLNGPHVARGPLFAHPCSRQCGVLIISQPFRPPLPVTGIDLLYGDGVNFL